MRELTAPLVYPPELPITERHDELLAAIGDHQVVVVAGETGSGKSTQLPKLCLELGRGTTGIIAHTQPRRIAARSLAERIASELGGEVGGAVGYAVRFTDQVGPDTMVKLMTDGLLLAEIGRDRRLSRYDTVIVDEAHERSLNIDFLLGYLHRLLPRQPDLKVIITSATIDTQRFSDHFRGAPVVSVEGRAHPVEVRYRPVDGRDQPEAICDAVLELGGDIDGDILVFCSGEREIRDAAEALRALDLRDTEILPLYARLSAGEQHRVFAAHRGRRIVVSTNVAETSLTVPGIRAVVDPGTARISRFNRRTKVQRLPIEAISQASANQRSGRCGRVAPGIAIRLYDEDDFDRRPEFTEPEILRTNLASVILRMADLGLGAVSEFPFVDPPDARAVRDGVALLAELGALEPTRGDRRDDGDGRDLRLTPVGRQLARLPVDPRLGRMLLAAADEGCLREVSIIVAGLAIQDPRDRPAEHREAADQAHARFRDPASDFLAYLHLWDHLEQERRAGSSSRFRRACREQYLHYLRVREWQDVHSQLRRAGDELKLPRNHDPAPADAIHQALLTGLLSHVGTLDRSRPAAARRGPAEYRGARGARFVVAPGSTFTRRPVPWLVAGELVETDRLRARVVAPVRPEWIERLGAHLLTRTHSDPWWDADRGSASTVESVSIYGLPLHTDRLVPYARIDRAHARALFIRHALVGGEWTTRHTFATRNREVIDEVLALEARLRRGDLLVGDEDLVAWFDARLPADVTDVRRFDRWWKQASRKRPDLLDLRLEDLVRPEAGPVDTDGFPDRWVVDGLDLPVAYEHDPDSHLDGVNVDVPLDALPRLRPEPFDWLVPGLRRDLVGALLKGLPKAWRQQLSPLQETVDAVTDRLDPASGTPIVEALARVLRELDRPVPASVFALDALPAHLRPTFRVTDHRGVIIADGHDLRALRELLADDLRASVTRAATGLERAGLTRWTIGDLPRAVDVGTAGHPVHAHPALVDDGDSVSVRVFADATEQADAMWGGLRRLLLLNRPSVARVLRSVVTRQVELTLAGSPYATLSDWFDDCVNAAVEQLMVDHGAPVWTAEAYERLETSVRAELPDTVDTAARASVDVLAAAQQVRAVVVDLRAPGLQPAALDLADQLHRLVYPGFVTGVGPARLPDLVRYLTAMRRRVETIGERTGRDRELMVRCQALEARFDRLTERRSPSPELEEVGWMLQELRVSLFAQQVGTRGTVSEKRITERLDRLERADR